MDLSFSISLDPLPEEVEALRKNLAEYNIRHSHIADGLDMMVCVYDASNQLVGGVIGNLWGECLEIDFLWVQDKLRGQGLGKRILMRLEEEAGQRGGRVAFLNTYSFQAPDFYLKQGYRMTEVIEGYPDGVKKIFLKKEF